ncbi:MAG: GDP-mannose 4,6-dehydratase [Candidatus Peribacteraceae bacterium]|nr:GDP-mannose 4,6-dehydratase [Candidatus Peribacteraceae bacterium]
MKKALITGITGQDGSYLSEHLLNLGYEVHGTIRRASSFNTGRIDHIIDRLHLHYGDLMDVTAMAQLLLKVKPDEIYNLAAQSHVRVSFDQPVYTGDVTGLGALRLLELVRTCAPEARYYQAGSSEMFGKVLETPQSITTPFYPRSPYACAKVFAHYSTVNYREAYGLHASNGILFNHESPRRGETFVTRKITRAVGRIRAGLQRRLSLGNLSAKRDWGFAGDYVRAMHAMLQQDKPGDFVIATGETWTVEQFLGRSFSYAGLNWREHVDYDARLERPTEVDLLLGDSRPAREKLGWKPNWDFYMLVDEMTKADILLAEREAR